MFSFGLSRCHLNLASGAHKPIQLEIAFLIAAIAKAIYFEVGTLWVAQVRPIEENVLCI